MATQFCQKCKQAHPGRVCDYDEKGECAETVGPKRASGCDAWTLARSRAQLNSDFQPLRSPL